MNQVANWEQNENFNNKSQITMAHGYYGFAPYVTVGEKKLKVERQIKAMLKKGIDINPVKLEGRKIAKTFWGKSWCENLLSYNDFSNRLPRGSAYVKNGFVIDLRISAGRVSAMVAGTSSKPYKIEIKIVPLSKHRWKKLKKKCAGKIDSLIELLQGKLSDKVLEIIIDKKSGLFPSPKEISLKCSCPDWATMCKHVAAALYAVGARLDESPELFFVLRGVDYNELVENIDASKAIAETVEKGKDENIGDMDIADVFGIEMDEKLVADGSRVSRVSQRSRKRKAGAKKAVKKKAVKKKVVKKKAIKKKAVKKKAVREKAIKKKAIKKKAIRKRIRAKKAGK